MRTDHRTSPWRALVAALLATALTAAALVVTATGASAAGNRIMLRALLVDDGTLWADAMVDQFTMEGVPFTRVDLTAGNRPQITAAFLASGTTANFNAVVMPDDAPVALSTAELGALATYEAQFGVRQVNLYNWANPTVGLKFAQNPGYIGDLTGMTGTVTDAARADGFGYLAGTLPIGIGSYGYLATPAGPGVMPVGGTFTPYVTVPIPGTTEVGSLVGVYRNGGTEKLVVTAAMSTPLSQWRTIAHGVVTWVTRGIHFGHNRNYFTFHYDDAFSYDARWDTANNCTPGEDCPATVPDNTPIRMAPADVTAVVNWQRQNGYTITLPFNAYHTLFDINGTAWPTTDPLTTAFVNNRNEFRWLNHGYEHVFQGCVQDFTVIPWVCSTTNGQPPAADGSNISWVSQAAIVAEINQNITRGRALGLQFDAAEYLSGEHSGLFRTPQQPVDNPNFASALTATGLRFIGADASREPGARTVGSATTIPRYPVAVYFNAATEAENVDEYNWFYTTRAQGGSGYCEDNPATATCMTAPLDLATGFESYIVPTDAANNLRIVMSNDPRPFYAHVSNLVGPDFLGLQLMSEILGRYRTTMAANTPVVNLTLTQASDILTKHQRWASAGTGATPSVTGYLQDGVVTVTNTGTAAAPVTLPAWATTSAGAAFGESYGGERSAWVTGNATFKVSSTRITSAASATFTAGAAGTFAVTTSSTEGTPALTVTGTLPAGVTFTDNGNGTATLAGTPAAGSGGSYPLTVTATTAIGPTTQAFTLNVVERPAFTSAAETWSARGRAFTFRVTTSGYPAATVTRTGTLPLGVTFTAGTGGTATLSGTPSTLASVGDYRLTFTATSPSGTTTQAFVLHLGNAPSITSTASGTAVVGRAFSKTLSTTSTPAATLSVSGLPAGLTFTPTTPGQGTITGTPAAGSAALYNVVVTAANPFATTTQNLALTVASVPAITSPATMNAAVLRSTSFTVTTTGSPTPTLRLSGFLPLGMFFNARSDGTATISGTPIFRGTTRVTVTASNAAGSVSQTLTIVVG